MPLPIKALARDTVLIDGQAVEYHSMSRAQALQLQTYKGREDEAEVFILVSGTGCSEDEARAFREGNDTETAGLLIDGILVLSGLAKKDEVGVEDAATFRSVRVPGAG